MIESLLGLTSSEEYLRNVLKQKVVSFEFS